MSRSGARRHKPALHDRRGRSTVASYLDYWLAEIVAPSLSPAAYVTYEYVARCYLVPGLGSKRVDRLQTRDVQTWLNAVGHACQCCAQGKDARRT